MTKNKIFQCKMCGQCCKGEGGIIVCKSEIELIYKYLNISMEKFVSQYLIKDLSGKYSIKINETGYCVFFNKDKGCIIHEVKPRICKAWPFFKGNLEDITSFEMAKEYCPGICKNISFDDFKNYGYRFLKQNKLINTENSGPNALTIYGV